MLQKPDWSYWTNLADVKIRDAVTLSCDVDPRSLGDVPEYVLHSNAPGFKNEHARRLDFVASGLASDSFPAKRRGIDGDLIYVELAEFRAWGEGLAYPLTFPSGFPSPKPQAIDHAAHEATRWPWGTHETDLLRKLAAAADKFWKLYDPYDATTAPTNDAVATWLKEQGVADRNAQIMATILRADNLPTGPRK